MIQTTLKIEGMSCGMCEAHIADVIRKQFPDAKKVSASHTKNIATFVTDEAVDPDQLKNAIESTGYYYKGYETAPFEKKGLFGGIFGKK
ncbi:MAG: heavy metal-associated domain-containing protein [Lachnospiraceae bacterium]|nr:heavy metal-associated domain-containing protein [Lachnospiraceae bacterium]